MSGRLRARGVTMRACSKNRAGYDRVLMAVAATFLTVSATSALAQADPARNSAAELAIDAAVPRPEPANVPPPTANDFKPDSVKPDATASVPDPATAEPSTTEASKTEPSKTEPSKTVEKMPSAKPADTAAAP